MKIRPEKKAKQFVLVQLPSLDIYSTTAEWKQVENLTLTRLRNAAKDHILLFKEISWPNARIEASSKDNTGLGAAIRLIANSCRIRIAMKKNMLGSSRWTFSLCDRSFSNIFQTARWSHRVFSCNSTIFCLSSTMLSSILL